MATACTRLKLILEKFLISNIFCKSVIIYTTVNRGCAGLVIATEIKYIRLLSSQLPSQEKRINLSEIILAINKTFNAGIS